MIIHIRTYLRRIHSLFVTAQAALFTIFQDILTDVTQPHADSVYSWHENKVFRFIHGLFDQY
ncbi:hypothetical protein, partial [Nitrosomonas communis]|uniref:hypothetical protein n=1 Tax=Nitrosomonas communis TaxID=44574 RepID=UPI001C434181